jgi:1-acyl-sn-glycerol-3-phosphate acyltransferase
VTLNAAASDSAERLRKAEERAVARWQPRKRWYHPLVARTVITGSRFVTRLMNRLDVEGREHLESVRERAGRGLLTISNHVSLYDDPLLTSNFVQMSYEKIRWVGADAINFFGNAARAWFYSSGRVVPIVRGAGIAQPGMEFLRDRLAGGEWVHMFPEGGRTRDPDGRMMPEFKNGTGWLIAQAKPLVLPFYHHGMMGVLPVGSGVPRLGKRVRVVFSQPIDCNTAWIDATCLQHAGDRTDGPKLWGAITSELYDILSKMERRIHPRAA